MCRLTLNEDISTHTHTHTKVFQDVFVAYSLQVYERTFLWLTHSTSLFNAKSHIHLNSDFIYYCDIYTYTIHTYTHTRTDMRRTTLEQTNFVESVIWVNSHWVRTLTPIHTFIIAWCVCVCICLCIVPMKQFRTFSSFTLHRPPYAITTIHDLDHSYSMF